MEWTIVNKSENRSKVPVFRVPESSVVVKIKKNTNKKKKNKQSSNPVSGVRKQQNLYKMPYNMNDMSSWIDSYTKAATWQMKHQIAFWKAKATALEVENRVLHKIIKQHNLCTQHEEVEQSSSEVETETDETQDTVPEDGSDSDLEVTEEYVAFMEANAKFKEDARQERERLKALRDSETEEDKLKRMEAAPEAPEQQPDPNILYGKAWKKIRALEVAAEIDYQTLNENSKPILWPNIPFNFNVPH